MKKEKKLSLYVWEGVLCDYTCGIAFALAHNVREARKMILKQIGNDEDCSIFGPDIKEIKDIKPDKYNTPIAFTVHGGG